jgi:sterol desaturase/sphingolipid hydroxylase (fatty acid hydroxylase superfamily)
MAQIGSYFFSGTRELVLYALGFALLETLWPAAADQPRWRRDTHVDLLYSFLVPILAFPAYWLALTAIVQLLHRPEAAGPLHVLHGWVTRRSLWFQVPAALVIADLSGYWRHRLLHTRWLWPFHAIHHSSQQVDWLSNERVHPVESVLTSLEQLVVLMVLGFGPQIVAVNALARRTHSLFEHSNLRFSYGPLNYLLVSPRFHRWHHSDDGRLVDKNFANFLSAFDFAFGTFHLPPGESAGSFGLPDHSIGRGFLGQLAYPFRRLAAEIRGARGGGVRGAAGGEEVGSAAGGTAVGELAGAGRAAGGEPGIAARAAGGEAGIAARAAGVGPGIAAEAGAARGEFGQPLEE